ncbi:MAL-like protein [Xenopus tropicalis]|uniref:LOC100135069 protein n=1 Tax=Xenopus tropicalis TaxID=8364 RepID=A9JR62_XENTR|nr:MAL-like protein [Xenopus tropicalis]AAI54916.1 LOC100135069 protein [Xenopus tropicalis]|eukprot:NP_001107280.1 MAL-like protein [Xenopus tropicalis]
MASQGIQMPSSCEVPDIPCGLRVFRTLPYAFILIELILGCWVWILVAATRVTISINNGWVMYVSVSCFLFSLILLMVYVSGLHRNNCGTWRIVDVIYHGIAAIFYLSAAVLVVNSAIICNVTLSQSLLPYYTGCTLVNYRLLAAASVFAFVTSLIYMLHSFQSYVR